MNYQKNEVKTDILLIRLIKSRYTLAIVAAALTAAVLLGFGIGSI